LYLGVVGSLLLRLSLFEFESGDYQAFLSPWYEHFVKHGRWALLGQDFSNYYVPYLGLLSLATWLPVPKVCAIKLISVAFDYVAAWLVYRLVRLRYRSGPLPLAAGLAMLFLPTVVMNSAVWGQCDVIYTTALLGSLYGALRSQPVVCLGAFGLACAFKPQGIFLAPFLVGLFFRGDLPWRWVWLPGAVYAACGMPAILAGKPPTQVLGHWLRQENLPILTAGAPNLYQWLSDDYFAVFRLAGTVLGLLAAGALVLSMRYEDQQRSREEWLVSAALLSVLGMPYELPGMHERYFFAADLFALVYAFYFPARWYVAAGVQAASSFSYLPFLFRHEPIPRTWLAVGMTAVLGVVLRDHATALLRAPQPRTPA
jgi:Gpi18-like mannosyltransferase